MDVGGKAVGGDTEEGEEEKGERRRRRREERRRDNGHAYAVYLGLVCAGARSYLALSALGNERSLHDGVHADALRR